MSTRQSGTLVINDGFTCCAKCSAKIGPSGLPWKQLTAVSVIKVSEIPGSTSSTHQNVEIRHFSCPKCLTLLDSETALPEDPFLDDVISN
jgi:acetone carboxylase gamma subunit